MSVELYDQTTPNTLAFVLAWLLPLADSPRALGNRRREDDPLPFRQVTLLDEQEDDNQFDVEALVSVHTFAEAAEGIDADTIAIREGDRTHRRMLLLARTSPDVTLPSGLIVNAESFRTVERPALRDYQDDRVSRVKAVYSLGFSFVAVD